MRRHCKAAEVEAAILLRPQHACDDLGLVHDGAATTGQMRQDTRLRLLQCTRRRVERFRDGGEGGADQRGDGSGVGGLNGPDHGHRRASKACSA
jgi:hypothetical protein